MARVRLLECVSLFIAKTIQYGIIPRIMAADKKTNGTFAVIKTGGKQYRVTQGDFINIEKLSDEINEGDAVKFEEVLLVDDGAKATVGNPVVSGAVVEGKFVENFKGDKVRIQKFKSKSNYDKVIGHRQKHSRVEITKISE